MKAAGHNGCPAVQVCGGRLAERPRERKVEGWVRIVSRPDSPVAYNDRFRSGRLIFLELVIKPVNTAALVYFRTKMQVDAASSSRLSGSRV